MNHAHGSIGWSASPDVGDPLEIVGCRFGGGELEIIGDDEIIGCACMVGHWDGAFGAGTDADWRSEADSIGFFGLIAGAIAGISAAVAGAAGTVAVSVGSVVAAVGGVKAVADMIGDGVEEAKSLIKAAEDGDEKAIAKLDQAKRKAVRERADKGKKKLAELMVRAKRGDLKAQAVLVGIDAMRSKQAAIAGGTSTLMRKMGVDPTLIPAQPWGVMKQRMMEMRAGRDWKKFEAEALALAKKSGKLPKDKPKIALPAKAMKAAAAAAIVEHTRREVQSLRKAKRAPGARGYLVADGRVTRGNWLPAVIAAPRGR